MIRKIIVCFELFLLMALLFAFAVLFPFSVAAMIYLLLT